MKRNVLLLNIGFNLLLTIIFVLLNIQALNGGLEETFVSLAFIYGLLTITGNAIFVAYARR